MKTLFALALPLIVQQAALPAWEVAPKWSCTMTKLSTCHGADGACTVRDNKADFHIDFAASTFRVDFPDSPNRRPDATSTPRPIRDEMITRRGFTAPAGNDPGASNLTLDVGDTVTLSALANADGSYDARVTRKHAAARYDFIGTCSPER